jgi:hypothetical protein
LCVLAAVGEHPSDVTHDLEVEPGLLAHADTKLPKPAAQVANVRHFQRRANRHQQVELPCDLCLLDRAETSEPIRERGIVMMLDLHVKR